MAVVFERLCSIHMTYPMYKQIHIYIYIFLKYTLLISMAIKAVCNEAHTETCSHAVLAIPVFP